MPTSEPSPHWQTLHPAMLLFELLRALRGYVLPVLAAAVLTRGGPNSGPPLFLMFLVFIPMMVAVARFAGYRYKLAEGHVTIREGLLSRKVRRIPVHRIHNINTSQNILARILGVLRLDIETAGGGSSEASLIALSRESATIIQDYVRSEKSRTGATPEATTDSAPPPVPLEGRLIHKVTPRDLFLAGATTSRMGVIFVVIFAALEYTSLDQKAIYIKATEMIEAVSGNQHAVLTAALIGLALLLVSWMLSIGTSFIRWHGFTLRQRGDDLEIRTGLFTLRQYTLPLDKIQALQCETSAIRRPFGLFRIKVRSAGHVGVQEQGRVEHDLLAPLTRNHQIDFFTKAVWPRTQWDQVAWQGVHRYTRLRQFRALAIVLGLVLSALHLFAGETWQNPYILGGLTTVGLFLAWGIAHLTWKQTAFGRDAHFVYIKTGFLGLHFWVIPISRIQNVAVVQSPFQRIRRLASLYIDTAGGGGRDAVIPNIRVDVAWSLFNHFSNPKQRLPHSMN